MGKVFLLSEFIEELNNGFYVFQKDILEEEFKKEEIETAQMLSQFGIEYPVPEVEQDIEEFKERLKRSIQDPFVYENNISKVLVKNNQIYIQFSFPGSGRRYLITLSKEEISELPSEAQRKLLSLNPYLLPYVDQFLIDMKEVKFFRSNSNNIYVKFIFSLGEVVYSLDKNKEVISKIKKKFDIDYEIEHSWEEFQAKEKKIEELRRVIKSALRIFRKESGIRDWLQYTVKYSDKIIYILKPRRSNSGEVYYSIFKVEKGIPQMGIPDKVEGLFAVSTDKFLKRFKPLLERKRRG